MYVATALQALGEYKELLSWHDLLDYWLQQLSKAERAILYTLAEVYPRGLSKAEIGEQPGYEALLIMPFPDNEHWN